MNETAERRQGAENACQRLRRRVLTATAALAAAALVFGWLAAGAVRRSEVFTWGSLEVSFTGEGFTGSPAVGEGVSECAPAVNVQPGSEACYLFLALGKTGGQQWGHRQHGHIRKALLFRNWHGVGKYDFSGTAIPQAFHGGTRQQAMRGNQRHGLRAGVVQCAYSLADGACGVDHVVNHHAVAAFDLADNAMRLGMVRASGVTSLVNEGERQIAQLRGPLLGNLDTAGIWRHDGGVLKRHVVAYIVK